ncbi:MAG: glycosyltransferase family 2 protein [Gemmatimonadales bacterium]|nr:glycosyltransferase family 2 protein [Gemmatimonadales bacterium]
MPRVSVVIPTWNGADMLRAALLSLRGQAFRDFETIVVDNGSTDGTVEMLAGEFPEVRLVALAENRGFAAATNAGLQAARGEILVCMNNDCEADPGWIAALVDALERRPDAGSVASKMLRAREPGIIDAAGDTVSLVAWNIGRGEPDGPRFAEGREVLSACAGAAAYRRTVFETVGWFDEDYFAWFEDVDLGLRAQIAGFHCWYEPTAVVHHLGSATANRASATKAFYTARNALLVFFKTMPLPRLMLWAPLMLLWPWVNPVLNRRPLGPYARAWVAFLRLLPRTWRKRRAIYARRPREVARVRALLDSPLDDIRRALRGARRTSSALASPAGTP